MNGLNIKMRTLESRRRRTEFQQYVGRKEAWKPPELGGVKLNVSSICEGNRRGAGLGVAVARDDHGRLLQAWAVAKETVENPVIAELEAVRVALLVALQNSWRKVKVQVDIKAIANSLRQREVPVLKAMAIAENIFLWH